MRNIILLFGVVMAALVAVLGANAATGKSAYAFKGEVYASGFRIEMVNRAGQTLKKVKAGTYRIKIEDKASIHNFHLVGPGREQVDVGRRCHRNDVDRSSQARQVHVLL